MQPLTNWRDTRKSDRPVHDWVGVRYKDCTVILVIGTKFFGGFSGKTGEDGQSMVKLRTGLSEAKLIWGLAKVRDYVRRLKDRGFEAHAYRLVIDRQIDIKLNGAPGPDISRSQIRTKEFAS
jgi:hypothetical protein